MRIAHALLAGLALTVVASCGNGEGGASSDTDTGGVAVLVMQDTPSNSVGAGIMGALSLVGHRCVGFDWAGHSTLLAFPPGTSVTGKGRDIVIHVKGGSDLRLGQSFSGGSLSTVAQPVSNVDLTADVPPRCQGFKVLGFAPE